MSRHKPVPTRECNVCGCTIQLGHDHSLSVQRWQQHLGSEKHKRYQAVEDARDQIRINTSITNTNDSNMASFDRLIFDHQPDSAVDPMVFTQMLEPVVADATKQRLGREEKESEKQLLADDDENFYFDSESYSCDSIEDENARLPPRRHEKEQEWTFESSDSMHVGTDDEVYFGRTGVQPPSTTSTSESTVDPPQQQQQPEQLLMDVEETSKEDTVLRLPAPEAANAAECSTENRCLYEFYLENRGKPLTKDAMSRLLLLLSKMKSVSFPESMHEFEKMGEAACPKLEPELVKLACGDVYSFDIRKVLGMILASKELTSDENWLYGTEVVDDGDEWLKRHVMMSRSVQVYKDEILRRSRQDTHLLLICSLWFDGYRLSISKNDVLTAVILRVENLRVPTQFLISLLPSYIDLHQYLDAALLPFFAKLETGDVEAYFAGTDTLQFFSGGINAVLGDHISQISLMGMAGPTATTIWIDRFLNLTKADIITCAPSSEAQFNALSRDVDATLNVVRNCKIGRRSGLAATHTEPPLRPVGLTGVSSFWSLEVFRLHFFARFALCRLHLILLGICQKTILWLGLMKGWNWCQALNAHVRSRRKDSLYSELQFPNVVFFKKESKSKKDFSKLRMISPNGKEVMALLKVIMEKPIWDTFEFKEQKLLIALLSITMIVYDAEFYNFKDLSRFDGYLNTCVASFRKLFREIFEKATVADEELLTRDWNGFNLGFPNSSALLSLWKQFEFFGDLSYSDGSRLEATNRDRRMSANSTNGRNLCRDVLSIEFAKHFHVFQEFATDEERAEYEELSAGVRKEDQERAVREGFYACKEEGKVYTSVALIRQLDADLSIRNVLLGSIHFRNYSYFRHEGKMVPPGGLFYYGPANGFWKLNGIFKLRQVIVATSRNCPQLLILHCSPVVVDQLLNGHAAVVEERAPVYMSFALQSMVFHRLVVYHDHGSCFVNTHIDAIVRLLAQSFYPPSKDTQAS